MTEDLVEVDCAGEEVADGDFAVADLCTMDEFNRKVVTVYTTAGIASTSFGAAWESLQGRVREFIAQFSDGSIAAVCRVVAVSGRSCLRWEKK